ncbi:MAG: hypothetical protein WDA65_04860 [Christensenellales bacterium]
MEFLLIIIIGVISAIVSAASKSKHKQSDDAPPRPFISDIQRALSFLDDKEQVKPSQTETEHTFNEAGPYGDLPVTSGLTDIESPQNPQRYQWGSLGQSFDSTQPFNQRIRVVGEQAKAAQAPKAGAAGSYAAPETKKRDKPETGTGSGLKLLFESNEIVRGIVYSEILTRKSR